MTASRAEQKLHDSPLWLSQTTTSFLLGPYMGISSQVVDWLHMANLCLDFALWCAATYNFLKSYLEKMTRLRKSSWDQQFSIMLILGNIIFWTDIFPQLLPHEMPVVL